MDPSPAHRRRGGNALPLVAAMAVGVVAGLGGFSFAYGEGAAYLSDDPTVCSNCHVMQPMTNTWENSSHARVAVCNDCHLPPDFVGHWLTKADNGLLHSVAFTTGDFPDPIQIKPRNARRTQAACLNCHGELIHPVGTPGGNADITCVQCHADVGHALR